MTFVDSGILVGALLEKHPEHKQCETALLQYRDGFTDANALAETFATLTGFYKVPTDAAAELTLNLRGELTIQSLTMADYETAIAEARRRGVMGGGIYDSLHGTFARRRKAKRIVTRNPSHFAHVAPDVEIVTP
jgi:predicted nucleic acid-binding protein